MQIKILIQTRIFKIGKMILILFKIKIVHGEYFVNNGNILKLDRENFLSIVCFWLLQCRKINRMIAFILLMPNL